MKALANKEISAIITILTSSLSKANDSVRLNSIDARSKVREIDLGSAGQEMTF